jgi:hypothetical protein
MVDAAKVKKAYKGRAKRCCCGCSGEYFYNGGYTGGDGPADQQRLERIVRRINKALADPDQPKDQTWNSGDHVAVEVGNRLYIAYFSE